MTAPFRQRFPVSVYAARVPGTGVPQAARPRWRAGSYVRLLRPRWTSAASESAFLGPYAYFPTGRGQQCAFTRRWREFGRICAARNSTLPRHLSTADSARDLNLLRQALGQPKLNYMTAYFRAGALPPKGAVCGQNLPPFPLPAG